MNPKKPFEPGLPRLILTAVCACLLTAIPASAQISVVNTANNLFSNSNLTTYSFAFNAGASANKLVVSAGTESGAAISSIKYNGVDLTLIPNTSLGRNRGIWYLDNPFSSGTASIVVTGAAQLNHMRLGVASISGSAPGAAIGNIASAASVSLNVPVTDSFVLAAHASNHDGSEPAIGVSSPLTQIFTTGGDSARHAAGFQNLVAAGTATYSFANPTDPQSSVAAFVPASAAPVIVSTVPTDNATNAPLDANLVVAFSEPVVAGTGIIELWQVGGGAALETFNVASSPQLPFSGQTLTINPISNLTPGVEYYVLIPSTAVVDTSGGAAFGGISDPTAWNFTAAFYDDFNDGNDDGWTRQSPLTGFGAPAVFSFPGSNSYQISSPVSPNPGLLGPARAGSLRLDQSYGSYFQQSVDIVDWDNTQSGTSIGMLARISQPGLGTTDGYAFTITLSGTLEISRITDESPVSPPVATASIGALSTANDYRLVFTGDGSTLSGQIFHLANLTTPIATISGSDATYASGHSGLIVSSSSSTQTATATFDNYTSAPFGTPIVKAFNTDNLALGSSWAGGVAPASTDRAKWDSTVTGANTTSLGADLSFGGIVIANPTGPVTINPGNTLSLDAGLVDIDLSAATQDLTLNCPLSVGAPNVWDVTSARTLALGGVVSGSAGVTKQGAGTAVLSNANTYTGGTAITAGTLKLSGTGTPGAAGASVAVSSGALLDLNGTSRSIAFTAGTGVGTVANNSGSGISTLTLATNPAANILIKDNTNSSSGKVAVVIAVSSGSLGPNSYSGGTTVNAGASLYLNGAIPTAAGTGPIALTAGTGSTATSSGLFVDGTTYTNDITGAGYIHNNGNGAFTAVFTGTLNTSGTFNFRNASAAFDFAGSGNSTLSGVIGPAGAGGVYGPNATVSTGSIIKSGSGTLTLSGNNLYTGNTTVSGGTLALLGGSQRSPITVQDGAALGFDITTPTSSTKLVTLNAGHKISVSGSPTDPSYTLLTTSATIAGTPNLNPAIPGYTLTVDGGNTLKLVLAPTNTFASWITNPAFGLAPADQDLGDDPDGDGIDNGVENFFGTNPGVSSSGLVSVSVAGGIYTFTHPQNATPASDLTPAYAWSKDLATFLANGATDGALTKVDFTTQLNTPSPGITTVTATVTGTAASNLFVHVNVTQP